MTGGLALLVLVMVLGLVAIRSGPRRVLVAAAATSLVILIPVRSVTSAWPPPRWIFVARDVGQGDALLLNAGHGAAVEIDAGPDPVAIDRCLRNFGVTRIPLLVFTHLHLDHVGGIVGAARGRHIDRILTGPLAEPASGLVIVHRVAAARGLVIRTPSVGSEAAVGAVHLDVLGPSAAFHGTRSNRTTRRSFCARLSAESASCYLVTPRSRRSSRCLPPALTCARTCSRCRITAPPTPIRRSSPLCTRASPW